MTAQQPPILEMRQISKRFDATQALDDVSLALYPGEIHALLGSRLAAPPRRKAMASPRSIRNR
jgi:ABC-type sugar transport system ATPase subunit